MTYNYKAGSKVVVVNPDLYSEDNGLTKGTIVTLRGVDNIDEEVYVNYAGSTTILYFDEIIPYKLYNTLLWQILE